MTDDVNISDNRDNYEYTGFEIAVIGMAGRFPSAGNIEEFWERLKNGEECIAFFDDDDLRAYGLPEEEIKNPQRVRAYGWLDGIEYFDAAFFGYTPFEAEIMDPQMRVFHECAWEALENAGYDPFSYRKLIGIYAGATANFKWRGMVEFSGRSRVLGWFATKQFSDKDFLSSRVAYKLNLKGPAFTLDSACSTSLLAVHLAGQALVNGDCDMALAGGVTISQFYKVGFIYQEGMVNSPDGHCRTFDAKANGSNFGNATAAVVLKRFEDAEADGDTIYAVIKGSATNNDGDRKAAYTAPSIDGQAGVIKTAYKIAEVHPETISYVEAHGTGTSLGDPVEIESLKLAFNTKKKHFCHIGSVKTNMGHLEMAAGVAGLIKTVLALKYKLIPPSLHYETPNPKIDFKDSPFIVNRELTPWRRKNPQYPLRAAVSSFGIGGTNIHLVLEEAPEREGSSATGHPYHLLLFSARTETALEQMTRNLEEHLTKNPGINLPEVAYTLQVGRKKYTHRRMLVCSRVEEAIELLSKPSVGQVSTYKAEEDNRPIVFMFPGLGAQYVNMGRELYESEPFFRNEMNRCFEILEKLLGYSIKDILYPPEPLDMSSVSHHSQMTDYTPKHIDQPEISQLVVFIFEIALARLLIHWGIKPSAMIGYSFGEYAAACVAGVYSLEQGIKLVEARGRMVQKLPAGAMLSVPLSMDQVQPLLDPEAGLSLAIDNGPSCVVSGTIEAIDRFEKQMKERKTLCMKVPATHALHSRMMEPITDELASLVGTLSLNPPQIPYISNVSGDWISAEQAQSPGYWADHLSQTVRFAEGMKRLLSGSNSICLELGASRDISTLTMRYLEDESNRKHQVISLVRHPRQEISDLYYLLNRIGKLWLYGQPIDWQNYHGEELQQLKRIPLPSYPFERQRYWIETNEIKEDPRDAFEKQAQSPGQAPEIFDFSDKFYIPVWTRSAVPASMVLEGENILAFVDENPFGTLLIQRIKSVGHRVLTVKPGSKNATHPDYMIDLSQPQQVEQLFIDLAAIETVPTRILFLWTLGDAAVGSKEKGEQAFYSLLNLAKALANNKIDKHLYITVVTQSLEEVTGDEPINPWKALIHGPLKVIPQEIPGTRCHVIDIVQPEPGGWQEEILVEQLLREIFAEERAKAAVVAYRGNYRWEQTFNPISLPAPKTTPPLLKENGVYVLLGGMGKIGFTLAHCLAGKGKIQLAIIGRSATESRAEQLKQLEELGCKVVYFQADLADYEQMHQVISRVEQTLGPVNGVIHAAGLVRGSTFKSIREIEEQHCREQFRSKVIGLDVLAQLFHKKNPDFCWIISSISTVLGGLHLVAYTAANSFMDAFAKQYNRTQRRKWFTLDWEGDEPNELQQVCERLLALDPISSPNQVVFCRDGNLHERIRRWINPEGTTSPEFSTRPELLNPYKPPENPLEEALVKTWQTTFGFGPIGTQDDFIELGGDSLKAIAMIARVHEEMSVAVPLTDFFKNPTIQWLAQYISGAEKVTRTAIPPVEKKEYYPLSFIQERIFVLHRMEELEGSIAYNNIFPLLARGKLEQDTLKKTLTALIARHESLRTSFALIEDEPVQIVHDTIDITLENLIIPEIAPGQEGFRGILDGIIKGFVKPFDLEKAPLMRMGVGSFHRDLHLVLLDMHHIISDGATFANLTRDFVSIYDGEELPPLKIQYKDFSEWQNYGKGRDEIEKQEKYWQEQLALPLPILELKTDMPRPAIQSFAGEKITINLKEDLKKEILNLVKETETTLYMMMLAISSVVLYKYTGQEDLLVGTPVAARDRIELEPVVGVFINALVLRISPQHNKSFREILLEIKETTLKAFENQGYPFGKLMKTVKMERDLSRNPLYDFELIVQNIEEPELKTHSLQFENAGYDPKTAQVDITLEIRGKGSEMLLKFIYCTQLFRRETIERFIGHFKEVIAAVIANPGVILEEIHLTHDYAAAQPTMMQEEQGDFGF